MRIEDIGNAGATQVANMLRENTTMNLDFTPDWRRGRAKLTSPVGVCVATAHLTAGMLAQRPLLLVLLRVIG